MQSIKSAAKIFNILNYFHLETYKIDQDARDGLSPIDTPRPSTLKSMFQANYRGEAELISKHSSCRYNYFECQKSAEIKHVFKQTK